MRKKMKQTKEKGITLIALVVTIVVLLILAGVTITVLFGDHGIFGTAQNATNKFGIEAEREKINNVLIDWWTKKVTGENVTVEDFFKMLQPDIITDRSDVTGPDDNNTYIVETNNGYTVEIIVDEKGNIQIGDIEKGNLGPRIKNLKVIETTANSIKVKGEFLRAENATIQYYYKLSSNTNENSYIEITDVTNGEAIATGLTEGTSYDIKVTVTMQGFEQKEKVITNIIARDAILINELILDKTTAMMGVNTTLTLNATIKPEDADIKDLIWSSSDETIATVDSNGKVTAKKEGKVIITVKATDASRKEANCNITVILADGTFSEIKGVNTPKLGAGMNPVVWDETANEGKGDWVAPKTIDDWYDYSIDSKKWANAMTEDGSMWVWIPRYAYQISNNYHKGGSSVSGTINIKFLKETTNTSADGKTTWDNASGEGNWNIHPGFEYDTTKPGIWVAKFEASSKEGNSGGNNVTTKTLQIKPGVSAWTSISVSRMYTVCLNYNRDLNSHLIKNTEWGVIAYLSKSSYGKNGEITINTERYCTGGGTGDAYKNKTSQSTTGTIYGIYDISGCNNEYVAAYVDNEYTKKENNSYYTEEYGKALIDGEEYTKNIYPMGEENTEASNYKAIAGSYGDAMYETSATYGVDKGWYGDCAHYPGTTNSFFSRGGGSGNGTTAGAFRFYDENGSGTSCSFRPVLIAP